jgi:hypothetical protein
LNRGQEWKDAFDTECFIGWTGETNFPTSAKLDKQLWEKISTRQSVSERWNYIIDGCTMFSGTSYPNKNGDTSL